MSETKINVELLERVKRHILEEPKRFDMGVYAMRAEGEDAPDCGTVACIAGWATILNDGKRALDDYGYDADFYTGGRKALRLTSEQAQRLFHARKWPKELLDQYLATETGTIDEAMVAARRIDRFIKTNGAE